MRFKDLIRLGKQPLPANPQRPASVPEAHVQEARSGAAGPPTEPDGGGLESPGLGPADAAAALTLEDDETAWETRTHYNLWAQAYETVRSDSEHLKLLDEFEEYIREGRGASLDGAVEIEALPHAKRLEAIQKAAAEKLDELPRVRLSLSIAGKSIAVRAAVQKAVKAVTTFKDVIGSAISAEPLAALAWAGVMAILPLLETALQQDDDAADGLNNIIFLLVRYQVLEDEFLTPESRDPSQPKSARQLLLSIRTKLVSIYAQIYVYEVRFVLQYARGRAHRFLRNAAARDGWKDMWADIESTSRLVDQGVEARTVGRTLEISRTVNDMVKKAEALQQTTLASVQDGNQTRLLLELGCAGNALFDSAEVLRTETQCLEGTRLSILNNIQDWVEDPAAEPIYWLHGMAGTGKTSVALTVANALNHQRPFAGSGRAPARGAFLGASFFFKQGDATRNTTKVFFTTIARRLAQEFPDLKVHISNSVNEDLEIGSKDPFKQFSNLIVKPLSLLDRETLVSIRLVVVVDALDECVRPADVEQLLGMLVALQNLHRVQLRVFLTSRADEYIVKCFEKCLRPVYRSSVLDKVPYLAGGTDRTDDITRYLAHTLAGIAEKWNVPQDWIGQDGIAKLSKKADGLFIYAATACRFLDAEDFSDSDSRQELLGVIFDNVLDGGAPQQKVDEIYLKVLSFKHLKNARETTRQRFFASITKILGFIAVFFEPVSPSSLASFLLLQRPELDEKLRRLHSVIDIPRDENLPIRLVHLSFRDFLLSEERSRELPFRVEESPMHRAVLERCLELMSRDLRQDMCSLVLPGQRVSEITPSEVETNISRTLQYACCYWVDHLAKLSNRQRVEAGLSDDGKIYQFLREKLMFWLEAMSLIQKTAIAVLAMNHLGTLLTPSESPRLSDLVNDAKRFVLTNRWIIERAPLQIYCSALLFSPTKSQIRSHFEHLIPSWIAQKPRVNERWSSLFSELEGHTDVVTSVAFCPSDGLIVSGSLDRTTRIWDYITGTSLYEFDDLRPISCVAFSPDGRIVATGLASGVVRVREFARGTMRDLTGHSDAVKDIAFSPQDSNILASVSSDKTLRVWDIRQAREVRSFSVPEQRVCAVAFSPNGEFIATGSGGSKNGFVRLWKAEEKKLWKILGHQNAVTSIAISTDGQTIVSGSHGTAKFWNTATGEMQYEWNYDGPFGAIAYHPTNRDLVAIRTNRGIKLLHTNTWKVAGAFHTWMTRDFSFSRDGSFLAAACGHENVVRLWDTTRPQDTYEDSEECSVHSITFLPSDGDRVAVLSGDQSIRIWSAEAGAPEATVHVQSAKILWLSPDGRFVVIRTYDETVQVWDKDLVHITTHSGFYEAIFAPNSNFIALISRDELRIVDCTGPEFTEVAIQHCDCNGVMFSPNSQVVAWNTGSRQRECTLHLWDIVTKKELLQCRSEGIGIIFSPDSTLVAVPAVGLSYGGHVLLEVATGKERGALSAKPGCFHVCVVFHPEGQLVATGADDGNITLWDTRSGKESFSLRVYTAHGKTAWGIIGLAISATGKLVAACNSGRKGLIRAQAGVNVRLWDLKTRAEIGRYRIDAVAGDLSFSADCRYLLSNIGTLPVPPAAQAANQDPSESGVFDMEAAESCLYVGSQWVRQGFEDLLWLPLAYRVDSDCLAVRGGDYRSWVTC